MGRGTDYFLDKSYPGQNISGTSRERDMSEFVEHPPFLDRIPYFRDLGVGSRV